jgi:hypothetical protein
VRGTDDQINREPPLTDEEIRETREMLVADKRMKWLFAAVRRITVWVAAGVGALVVTWDALVKVIRHIAGN